MPLPKNKNTIIDYAFLVGAGLLYGVALKYFVFPAEVILTGTEGIATALSYYFEVEWLFLALYALCQSVLLTFAYRRVSKRFALRSGVVVLTVLASIPLLPEFQFAQPEPHNERILLVIFGGILAGSAKAVAFRRRGSTGDEDILGAYFASKYLKPVGYIGIWAGVVSTLFGMLLALIKTGDPQPVVNTLMYTSIYIFVSAETLNNFFHKFRLKMVRVITSEPKKVTAALMQATSHRTFTMEAGRGGYSDQQMTIISTVITQEELPTVLGAIKRAETQAFAFHHEIDGIAGTYFIEPIG